MNLIMASVLLLAMLAFQPTLIYGTKSLASATTRNHNMKSLRNVKRHSMAEARALQHGFLAAEAPAALSSAAKLVLSMESGDVLVRSARGAGSNATTSLTTNLDSSNTQNPLGANVAANGGNSKRQKNNKKLNKNLATQESSLSAATSTVGHKHSNKKSNAAAAGGVGAVDNSGAPINANYQLKKRNRERQVLKSQERHQGKKANKEAAQNAEEKQSTTCRYSKSAWTECDATTNMRSRTLTLKKGDANCLPTRTMQKKCKKTCRYEKGTWSECANGKMTREDKLKSTGTEESSCEPVRNTSKKCNPNNGNNANGRQNNSGTRGGGGGSAKKEHKNKEKGSRRKQE